MHRAHRWDHQLVPRRNQVDEPELELDAETINTVPVAAKQHPTDASQKDEEKQKR